MSVLYEVIRDISSQTGIDTSPLLDSDSSIDPPLPVQIIALNDHNSRGNFTYVSPSPEILE